MPFKTLRRHDEITTFTTTLRQLRQLRHYVITTLILMYSAEHCHIIILRHLRHYDITSFTNRCTTALRHLRPYVITPVRHHVITTCTTLPHYDITTIRTLRHLRHDSAALRHTTTLRHCEITSLTMFRSSAPINQHRTHIQNLYEISIEISY